jgi:dTDP-4-dehydrorhamnose reductase
MKKILVTGSNGQLGKCLQDVVMAKNNNQFQFLFFDRSHLDISNQGLVESFFFSNKIDYVVNCAAYTAVDLAETEVEQAFKINSDGVKYLAEQTFEQGAKFIHVSTDYVFDGSADKPYLPNDEPNPINVYGKSKWEGEKWALELNPRSFVIRTSWVYSQYGKNFYTTMTKLMAERDELNIVADQIGKPTNANDLAEYIYSLIESDSEEFGIHHFSGEDQMSWFEFAQKIAAENGFSTKLNPITTAEYPTPAKRPMWSVLGKL